jgi:hypothetical protein
MTLFWALLVGVARDRSVIRTGSATVFIRAINSRYLIDLMVERSND